MRSLTRNTLSVSKLDDAHSVETNSHRTWQRKSPCDDRLEILRWDWYGVKHLRGIFLNVREMAREKISNTRELKSLRHIIELDFNRM